MATYAKGRERRAQILRVAREVFATRRVPERLAGGHRGAGRAVGDGTAAPLPSKDHLLTAVLEERDDSEIERTWRQVEEEHRSRAEALLDLCRRNATRPEMVRLFTVVAAESVDAAHPAHEWFVER